MSNITYRVRKLHMSPVKDKSFISLQAVLVSGLQYSHPLHQCHRYEGIGQRKQKESIHLSAVMNLHKNTIIFFSSIATVKGCSNFFSQCVATKKYI
jgi:hypothetical protein